MNTTLVINGLEVIHTFHGEVTINNNWGGCSFTVPLILAQGKVKELLELHRPRIGVRRSTVSVVLEVGYAGKEVRYTLEAFIEHAEVPLTTDDTSIWKDVHFMARGIQAE